MGYMKQDQNELRVLMAQRRPCLQVRADVFIIAVTDESMESNGLLLTTVCARVRDSS